MTDTQSTKIGKNREKKDNSFTGSSEEIDHTKCQVNCGNDNKMDPTSTTAAMMYVQSRDNKNDNNNQAKWHTAERKIRVHISLFLLLVLRS